MGATKRQLEIVEDYRKIAYDILIEIGAIKECEFHSDYYYETFSFDEKAIYGICANKLKEKYGENQDFNIFNSQVSEIMKCAAASSTCPYCEKE